MLAKAGAGIFDAAASERDPDAVARRRLIWLALAALAVCALFMTLGARGSWSFILWFRGAKLLALLLVGACIAVSTVLFQTICGNRILTPSIMGFDALYVLLQSSLVLTLGGFGYASLPAEPKFAAEVALLMIASTLLFGTLLSGARQDIQRMVLTGVIFGVLFRSLNGFVQRLIDPNEFAVVQSASFAQFNAIDLTLLGVGAALAGLAMAAAWRLRHQLDVAALGRDPAISLGVAHRRLVLTTLVIAAALVSVSTALVGPVAFFGLLVASLAHLVVGGRRHALLMLAAALIAAIALVGGQTLLERVLGLETVLSVVVEFLGGMVFLAMILKGRAR